MERSESIKELATALAKAQAEIEGAAKDKDNPFFKSKYADLGNVVEAIKPAHKHGLSFIQPIHEMEGHARVETIILHSSGEWISCGCVTVPVAKADAQGYGSALTYCRRYSLSAAFGVAPEDDDGNEASKPQRPPQQAQPKPAEQAKQTAPKQEPPKADPNTPIGTERANKFLKWAGENYNIKGGFVHAKNAAKKYFGVTDIATMTGKQLLALTNHLEGTAPLPEPGDSEDSAFKAAKELETDIANGADVGDSIDAMFKHSTFDGNEDFPARLKAATDKAGQIAIAREMRDLLIGKQETA